MTRKEINELLEVQHGASIVPGYNYVIFSVRTPAPDTVARLIQANKAVIDAAIGKPLLPYTCYVRKKSVVIPVPFDVGLNVLAAALETVLAGADAQIPSWS